MKMNRNKFRALAIIIYVITTAGMMAAIYWHVGYLLIGAIAVLGYGLGSVCMMTAYLKKW